jgi:hypothetical protein
MHLTRRQIYDLVWSKPLSKLANEFGLSDQGLAKACRRYDIPVPPLGYWQKLAHGKQVDRMRRLRPIDFSVVTMKAIACGR